MATCKWCKRQLTWTEQRRQYGRLYVSYDKSQRNMALPGCQKCVTRWMEHNPPNKPMSATVDPSHDEQKL